MTSTDQTPPAEPLPTSPRWQAEARMLRLASAIAIIFNPLGWVTDWILIGTDTRSMVLLLLRLLAGAVHLPVFLASRRPSAPAWLERVIGVGFVATASAGVLMPAVLRPTSVASQGGPLLLIIVLYNLTFPPWRTHRTWVLVAVSACYLGIVYYWRGINGYGANHEIFTIGIFLAVVSVLLPQVTRRVEAAERGMAQAQAQLQHSIDELQAEAELRALREAALEQARRDAEAANAAKSRFLANVSHELRTPLTAISGALSLIRGAKLSPEQQANLLTVCDRNSQRLLELVNALLDMQSVDAGVFRVEPRKAALVSLMRDCEHASAGLASHHNVQFLFEPFDEGLMVEVDPPRFQQILANLLSNAAKHSPEDAAVMIRCIPFDKRGPMVRIEVVDHGSGVPESFRDRAFRRFSMADASHEDHKGGTGLGLAITKALVEAHGGEIGFESELDEGSTFWFELPLVQRGSS